MALSPIEVLTAAVKAAVYGGGLAAAGAALFLVVFPAAPDAARRAARESALWLGCVALAGTAAQFVLQSYALSGEWAVALSKLFLSLVIGSPFGMGLITREIGLILLLIALASWHRLGWLGVIGAAAIVFSFTFAGHVQRAGWPAQLLLTAHLAAVAYWIGALWPLLRLVQTASPEQAVPTLGRFGNIALYAVPALIAAGAVLAVVMLGSVSALWATAYGRLLAAKLLAVSGLLALATLNKLRFTPSLTAGESSALTTLSRSIVGEILFVVLILALTASLTSFTGAPNL